MKRKSRPIKIMVAGHLATGQIASETFAGGLLTGYKVRVGRRIVWVATDEVVQ
jgi:hypothetical protein